MREVRTLPCLDHLARRQGVTTYDPARRPRPRFRRFSKDLKPEDVKRLDGFEGKVRSDSPAGKALQRHMPPS